MSLYSKIFHHISVDDVKQKRLDNIIAEKLRLEEKLEEEKKEKKLNEYITSASEKLKPNCVSSIHSKYLNYSKCNTVVLHINNRVLVIHTNSILLIYLPHIPFVISLCARISAKTFTRSSGRVFNDIRF